MDRVMKNPSDALLLLIGVVCTISTVALARKDERPSKQAFVTMTTPAFAMGAVALGHTLRKHHGNKYDLVCLVTKDVNDIWREILSQWWKVIVVEEYRPFSHFRRSWTKLRVWELTEYDKVVYLDTDVIVLRPLDELFEKQGLSCGVDVNPPQICNTGVMVVEPREGFLPAMDYLVRVKGVQYMIGDQGPINAFYYPFNPLKAIYNVPRGANKGFGVKYKSNEMAVAHFVCKKPWKCGRNETCGCGYPFMNQVWWEIWDEACSNHKCLESWKEDKVHYKNNV